MQYVAFQGHCFLPPPTSCPLNVGASLQQVLRLRYTQGASLSWSEPSPPLSSWLAGRLTRSSTISSYLNMPSLPFT